MRWFAAAFFIVISLTATLHAKAQSFVDIARTNPAKAYFYIKRSLERDGGGLNKRDPQNPNPAQETRLEECAGAGAGRQRGFDDLGSRFLLRLADHAHGVLTMEEALEGYPDSVWKVELEAYEKAQIARITAGENTDKAAAQVRKSLARKADDYRRSHPKLPKVVAKPYDCLPGDEKYKVKFTTEPSAHRIQYVSMRVFEYCEEAVADVQLREKCNMWTDAGNGIRRMIGTYKVRVFWSEDKSELFNVKLDEVEASEDGIKHYLIERKAVK
jgi:hypothetical protein